MFIRRLYRFDAGSDLIWSLSNGYKYIIHSIIMDAQNEATDDSMGVCLRFKTYAENYGQIELGLLPLTACVNDRMINNINYVLDTSSNPFIEAIGNAWCNRCNVTIEYDMIPVESVRDTTPKGQAV